MVDKDKPTNVTRRTLVRLIGAIPFLSVFGFAPRYAASDEFIEVNGWILKRSDLRPRSDI